MEREESGLSLEQVVRAVITRKKAFSASFVAGAFVFGAAAAAIPPSYKASVIMTIDPGRYPNDFLRPNVIPGLDTRLGGMEKMLTSAPVIEELRVRTGLAAKDRPGGVLQSLGLGSDPIDAWRKAFKFEIPQDVATTGNHKVDEAPIVEMSFKAPDPEVAARVVNECAKRANEENNRFRRAFVEEVVRFIQKAEERAKEVSRQRDEAFNSFKLANTDRLPEQEPFITAKLGQLRIRYADLKQSERFAEARLEQLTSERGLLVAQIALNVQLLTQAGGDKLDPSTPIDLRQQRIRVQTEVDTRDDAFTELSQAYTDRDPRVQAAKELLEKAKSRLAEIDRKLALLNVGAADTAAVGTDGRGAPPAAKPEFKPEKEHKLFPDDPYYKPGQKVPNAPLTPRLDHTDEKGAAPAQPADKPADRTDSPIVKNSRVVDVLVGENVDEKTLAARLDELSYRLVVSNPGYGRIRQIDTASKETRDSLKELARQREDSFSEIRKCEDQLSAIPEVRQRLEALARDVVEAREDFRRLQDQLDNARKALEVENEGKGEQFRVIDFARPPSKPSGPGRIIFVGLAVALALGFAAALCVLLDLKSRGVFATLLAEPPAPAPRAAAPRREAA